MGEMKGHTRAFNFEKDLHFVSHRDQYVLVVGESENRERRGCLQLTLFNVSHTHTTTLFGQARGSPRVTIKVDERVAGVENAAFSLDSTRLYLLFRYRPEIPTSSVVVYTSLSSTLVDRRCWTLFLSLAAFL